MSSGKLLWVLLGLSLLVFVIAKSTPNDEDNHVEEEEELDDEDDECDPDCEKDCNKLKCTTGAGVGRDNCGCCECKLAEGGTAPIVVSGPHYMKNHTGGSAALSCEIIGDPIPFVSWLKTDVNNKTYELPGDDRNMMTLSQGGPEKHEITAW